MGSGGGVIDPADSFSAARLNQKTTFVGTGAEIAAIGTTYPGMTAFCTSTGSGFTVNTKYVRNAADSAWIEEVAFSTTISETTEQNTTPVTDDADFTAAAGDRYYAFFQLPTTEKFYIISGIEWKNGATVAGDVTSGVDVIDADPPTIDGTSLLAVGGAIAQSGTSAIQRNSNIAGELIRGGTICGAWISCSLGTATLREDAGASSQNQEKNTSYTATPSMSNNDAWVAATGRKYIKVYYYGYK